MRKPWESQPAIWLMAAFLAAGLSASLWAGYDLVTHHLGHVRNLEAEREPSRPVSLG